MAEGCEIREASAYGADVENDRVDEGKESST
jgi:hypothetical protein